MTDSKKALKLRQDRHKLKYGNLDEAAKRCEEKAIEWNKLVHNVY